MSIQDAQIKYILKIQELNKRAQIFSSLRYNKIPRRELTDGLLKGVLAFGYSIKGEVQFGRLDDDEFTVSEQATVIMTCHPDYGVLVKNRGTVFDGWNYQHKVYTTSNSKTAMRVIYIGE